VVAPPVLVLLSLLAVPAALVLPPMVVVPAALVLPPMVAVPAALVLPPMVVPAALMAPPPTVVPPLAVVLPVAPLLLLDPPPLQPKRQRGAATRAKAKHRWVQLIIGKSPFRRCIRSDATITTVLSFCPDCKPIVRDAGIG
jgi:hypothetical protein